MIIYEKSGCVVSPIFFRPGPVYDTLMLNLSEGGRETHKFIVNKNNKI